MLLVWTRAGGWHLPVEWNLLCVSNTWTKPEQHGGNTLSRLSEGTDLQVLCPRWTTAWIAPGCSLESLPTLVSTGCLSQSVTGQKNQHSAKVSPLLRSNPLLPNYTGSNVKTLKHQQTSCDPGWWSWPGWQTAGDTLSGPEDPSSPLWWAAAWEWSLEEREEGQTGAFKGVFQQDIPQDPRVTQLEWC